MQNGEGTKAEMVPVDLQWFVLYCDANRPTLEQCNDMYDASSDYDYTDDREEGHDCNTWNFLSRFHG